MNPPTGVPAGRTIAGWWRQLTPFQPRRFWLFEWLIHRLEVLAACTRSEPLESLSRQLLEVLRLPPASSTIIAARLGLDSALLAQLLSQLADLGLAHLGNGSAWSITEKGLTALDRGAVLRTSFERRTFCLRDDPPVYLPLTERGQPVSIVNPPPAPLRELREFATRPADWKRRAGFPVEVEAIFDLATPAPPSVPPWMRVPVDQSERLFGAFIQLPDGGGCGFAGAPDQSTLQTTEPILSIPAEGFAELRLPEPGPEVWRAAWLEWSRSARGVTTEVVEAAPIERSGHRLLATVPRSLIERLRATTPELFRGEIWLLAGDATCRESVMLEVRS